MIFLGGANDLRTLFNNKKSAVFNLRFFNFWH